MCALRNAQRAEECRRRRRGEMHAKVNENWMGKGPRDGFEMAR